jgi:hypothetical protein
MLITLETAGSKLVPTQMETISKVQCFPIVFELRKPKRRKELLKIVSAK